MQISGQQNKDIRCDCHNLIAKVAGGKIEIKCRRCKRIVKLLINK